MSSAALARVEREGRGEIVVPGTGEVAPAYRAARVGHQVIQAAESGRDVVHGALELGRVADVGYRGGDGYAPGSQPLGRGGQAGRVAGDQTDGRSLGGERLRHREADAPASPGDQRAAAAQAKVHGSLLSDDRTVSQTANATRGPAATAAGRRPRAAGRRGLTGPGPPRPAPHVPAPGSGGDGAPGSLLDAWSARPMPGWHTTERAGTLTGRRRCRVLPAAWQPAADGRASRTNRTAAPIAAATIKRRQ